MTDFITTSINEYDIGIKDHLYRARCKFLFIKQVFHSFLILFFLVCLDISIIHLGCIKLQQMQSFHYPLIVITIALYLLGRLCDDMGWYTWSGLSANGFEAIALGSLATSAILTIARRAYEQNGLKILFVESQARFIIPWSLVILIIILLFNIFGCEHDILQNESSSNLSYTMDYTGCCLYSVVILLTNLNYAVICNTKGDLPLLILFQIVLFAEIIYNGTLLLKFVGELKEKPKDYSILFISIFIAWQVLVMDLLFRAAYEEKMKEKQINEIEQRVINHQGICEAHQNKRNGGFGTDKHLNTQAQLTIENKLARQKGPK